MHLFFDHPQYTWPMVYCLETDPNDLISLDYKSLKETMKKPCVNLLELYL